MESMTWFFLLMVFGANGMAFEHHFAATKETCLGKDAEVRAAWQSGRHQRRGMGEIVGMRSVCVPTPPDLEQMVAQHTFRQHVKMEP